jgi:DNA-binding Xre family transcriptional regulator
MWGPDAFEWIVVHNCDTDCMDAFEWWAMRLVPESLILNTATVLNKNPKSGERERRADVARRGAHQAWRIKTGLSKYDNCEVAKMLKKANLKELAEATGISLATLYRARKNGALNISHSKFTAIQAYLSRHEATNGQV